MASLSLEKMKDLDRKDPLRDKRKEFALPKGKIYLDGNSLGCLPKATVSRVNDVVTWEWGEDLITSWNKADWINLPARVGAQIARLVGAEADEVVAADSTSVNLFKVLSSALKMQSGRTKIISEKGNFPTDLYMMQGLIEQLGGQHELVMVDDDKVMDHLDDDVAVLSLTHVNYKSGQFYDMAAITKAAQDKGILVIWDLSHSAGALPVDLNGANADFAVGCGYKYLNGGPGAPAFLFVARRHHDKAQPPLSGWMGHAAPFEFDADYRPALGVKRHLCGTPPVIGMSALEESLKVFDDVDMAKIRKKSVALTNLFIELVEDKCADQGFELASPRDADARGSQVSFSHKDGFAIMQALIDHGVVGDFRAPNIVRFGFTPLYVGYEDVWNAVLILEKIMKNDIWKQDKYHVKSAVT